MKKVLIYIGIALAAIGCTKNEVTESTPATAEISFSAGVATRVSSTNDCAWATDGTDQVGIFTNNDESNLLFSVDANGNMSSDSKLYPLASGSTRNYYAYYPYSEDQDSNPTMKIDLSSGSSTPLLWASVEGSNDENVTFSFSHQFAKVTFTLYVANGGNEIITTLKGAYATADFGIKTGDFSSETGDIELRFTKDQDTPFEYPFSTYLIPMEGVAGNVQLLIPVNGDTYVHTFSTSDWESGHVYNYVIAVGDVVLEDDN